jgi:hypothetical protein
MNTMFRYPATIIGCTLITVLAGGLLSGCQGGGSGPAMIQVPAEQRHDLPGASESVVKLPEERAFNIHLKNSSQNPGPSGAAQGLSDATPKGQAQAHAEASKGGQATAEFTLGHRVNHQADAPHQVTIEVEFQLDQTIAASEPPAAGTKGSAALQLVVQNEKRQQIALMPLIQADSDNARASGSTHEKHSIVVRFEPAMSYDVYLHGRVSAASSEDQEATAELKLSAFKLRFQVGPVEESRPAQASTAGGA